MTTQQLSSVKPLVPFPLRDNTNGVTGTNTVAATRNDLFSYQVPKGEKVVIKPGDLFAAFLKDAAAEIAASETVEVEVRDAAGQDRVTVLGPTIYQRVKEFQDRNKAMVFTPPGEVEVPERGKIVVIVKSATAVVAASSYFEAHIHRQASASRR